MPVQRTIFGHAIPWSGRRIPRRLLSLIVLVAILVIVTPIALLWPSVPPLEHVKESFPIRLPDHIPRPNLKVPTLRLPFGRSAHQPPRPQTNSTSGEVRWHNDWKWLHPFSWSITLDENRALLPPLRRRPWVYTFYDAPDKKDAERAAAEHELLLIWRRAWWAQGFRPVVLGRGEVMNNPLYQRLQVQGLHTGLEEELMRWLAWEHMGAGILVNWLTLPMGSYDAPLLSYLRQGDYRELTRYEGLRNGLFCGSKAAVTAVLKMAFNNPELNKTADFIDAVPKDAFKIDAAHESVTMYDAATLKERYKAVSDMIEASQADGLRALGRLITSHLHMTFQNAFSTGIAVLSPTERRLTAMVQPALDIASYLAECSDSPIPSSCPPNRPQCRPCVSANPLPILISSVYRNDSTLYTIGTVPHPYTLAALAARGTKLDAAYIRRKTERDRWISAATKELLGTGVGAEPRLLAFKEAVAGEWGSAHSLWLTPEKETPTDLDWHFGFAVPKSITNKGYSNSPIPGSKPNKPRLQLDEPEKPATPAELEHEQSLLGEASRAVHSKVRQQQFVRDMVEAWNLGDTEAWRFARAFMARSRVERVLWEEEEKGFAGGAASPSHHKSGSWSRWLDGLRS
ncbi:MAG: hypothetical protein M1823_003435 [Watsoniomyces obsoletus]|nr:MAG: hypothetical protein M1823_003435 [Watsoniomyces obsoletus]